MIVSNTEVTTYNVCRRQHHYRFGLGVEPRRYSFPLTRGIIGHEALAAYYQEMKEGSPVDQCKKACLNVIDVELARVAKEYPDDYDYVKILAELRMLLDAYVEYYRVEPFKIIEVEKVFSAPIANGLNYGMRLDLLVEYTKGQFRGDLAVWDHKFCYNFKQSAELEMDGQLPKYIKTARANGYTVSKGVFNQLRYRSLRDPNPVNIFRRTPAQTSNVEMETIWSEQAVVVEQIAKGNENPTRVLAPIVCKMCYFHPLCKAELMGQDIKNMLEVNYQKSTYGYVDIAAEEA